MVVEKITAGDINQISSLQPEGWPNITPFYQFYIHSEFCYPIKVIAGDKLVGIGSAIVHADSAWLGHIIVAPEFRSKGIGKTITQSLIDSVSQMQIPTISLIATDLGEPVYKKLGFEKTTDYLFYKRDEQNEVLVDHRCIKDIGPENFKQIIDLDREASGEDRSTLIKAHLEQGKFYQDGSKSAGILSSCLGRRINCS